LPNASNTAGLPAGLAAETISWADLSPRGRAILQLVGVPTGLGMTLTEIAAELRASVPEGLSTNDSPIRKRNRSTLPAPSQRLTSRGKSLAKEEARVNRCCSQTSGSASNAAAV
jgi:hypothetical protein